MTWYKAPHRRPAHYFTGRIDVAVCGTTLMTRNNEAMIGVTPWTTQVPVKICKECAAHPDTPPESLVLAFAGYDYEKGY